jgi:hypothetical protein
MSNPFNSSRRKIARAKKHLAQLKRKVITIGNKKHLRELFTEPDSKHPQNTVYKVRFTGHVPVDCSEITGDVVNNLREALDHATYGVALASGRTKILNAYFPFSADAAHFEANLKGRCADVPNEIYPLLRSYEPYKGGSDALWALNAVCIANKHKIIIPVIRATVSAGVNVHGTGFMSMPYTLSWDRTKNEMELITLGPEAQFQGEFHFGFFIAFADIEILDGKPVIPVLDRFVEIVEIIVNEIEAGTNRLFPIAQRKA